ncbi:MAG TPA: hypothetical protein VFR97_14975 [Capillimicrobium sp.]|nr:hypothetical protein [Capillimicrobium sp.]
MARILLALLAAALALPAAAGARVERVGVAVNGQLEGYFDHSRLDDACGEGLLAYRGRLDQVVRFAAPRFVTMRVTIDGGRATGSARVPVDLRIERDGRATRWTCGEPERVALPSCAGRRTAKATLEVTLADGRISARPVGAPSGDEADGFGCPWPYDPLLGSSARWSAYAGSFALSAGQVRRIAAVPPGRIYPLAGAKTEGPCGWEDVPGRFCTPGVFTLQAQFTRRARAPRG